VGSVALTALLAGQSTQLSEEMSNR